MSLIVDTLHSAKTIRQRLRNPPNAVPDDGIDLKRRKMKIALALIKDVSNDVFGPIIPISVVPSPDDLAFGPVIKPMVPRKSVRSIQERVCAKYEVTMEDLLSVRRMDRVVRPRHIGMYLSRKKTSRSLPEIGRLFGGRDHTTCMHAIRKIENLMAADPEFKAEIQSLLAEFE